MPRYFFDINDGTVVLDQDGTDCADLEEACLQAKRLLPDLARDEVPRDGDRRTFSVLVSDEERCAVYSATLTFTGLWLLR